MRIHLAAFFEFYNVFITNWLLVTLAAKRRYLNKHPII